LTKTIILNQLAKVFIRKQKYNLIGMCLLYHFDKFTWIMFGSDGEIKLIKKVLHT